MVVHSIYRMLSGQVSTLSDWLLMSSTYTMMDTFAYMCYVGQCLLLMLNCIDF